MARLDSARSWIVENPMDWLAALGGWIKEHPDSFIELFFAFVLAATAWASFRLSSRLASAELNPAVTVYLELDPERFQVINLVVKNFGRGAARNVMLTAIPNVPLSLNSSRDRLSDMAIFRTGLSFMGPGQELRSAIGTYRSLTKEPFEVQTTFERHDSRRWRPKKMRASFLLDVSQFEGVRSIGEQPARVSSKALKQIAEDVRHIKQGSFQSRMKVTVSRRYIFSDALDDFRTQWFGHAYINSEYSRWRHFSAELRRRVGHLLRSCWLLVRWKR